MRVLALVALGLVFVVGAERMVAAQPGATGVNKTVGPLREPFVCDRLAIAEGLPNSNVRAIVQDPRGFVWLGTQDGLVRYDGIKMRVYRPVEKDPTSLSSEYINALTIDASGQLWVGTAEKGVNLYDPETDRFRRFSKAEGLSSEGVTAILRDRKDRIWLAMNGGGLNRYEPTTGTFTKFVTSPLDVSVSAIDVDEKGSLWLGTTADGVVRWNPDSGATDNFHTRAGTDAAVAVTDPAILSIRVTAGTVWIGTDGDGLFALDPTTSKLVQHRHVADDPTTINDDHVPVVFEDRNHTVWIGTQKGLARLDPKSPKSWTRYEHDQNDGKSLAFEIVVAIYQDAAGLMWLGGFTVGACKFDEYRLRFGYHHTPSHTGSFFEDADGTLWVGTWSGLRKYERKARRLTTYHRLAPGASEKEPLSLDGFLITAIHRDRRGTLWLALKGVGLIGVDTKSEQYQKFVPDSEDPNALPVDWMFAIWEDPQGSLLLGTYGGGLVSFDPPRGTFSATTTDDSRGLTSNHIYALYPDPLEPKILWIGMGDKGGLIRFHLETRTATAFRHRDNDPSSLSHDDVLTVYREPSGIVWAGTYGGGVNRLDPATGKATHFTTSNSKLTNNTVFAILPGDDGKLWLSTNGGGLLQLDPKTNEIVAYGSSDGLQSDEFTVPVYLRSKSGELFFGGPNGFNAFRASSIKRDPYKPPVAMTDFKILNRKMVLDRPIWMLPSLEVSYDDSFEVQFAALAFAAPHKNRYAFMLEGAGDDFIETDRPFATFSNLHGGNYVLRVRASNQHGEWSETPIALQLRVKPPLWRTWPAYALYAILLVGAAYLIVSLQRRRIETLKRRGRLDAVERDLELTGAVQNAFLPEANEFDKPMMRLFGYYRPADACGGDWWWHEELPGGRHIVLVGDVTGHGPGPAMVTAAVATAFRVLVENGLDNAEQALHLLNREVLRVGRGKYHMTMAAVELNETTGAYVFYNAGAPPVLSLNREGKHKVHFCPGAPLGTAEGFEVGRFEGTLQPTDRLLLYTDGIPEIELPTGTQLGMRRFAQLYERTRARHLRDAAATILTHADQSRGNMPQLDDWTFAIIEWGAPS